MLPAPSVTDPYHVCFVVPDLERAMEDFTTAAGTVWNAVREATLDEWDYRIVFSTTVPHIELIEGPPGSPWDASDGPRFDHLGWWTASLDATIRRLAEVGLPADFDGRVRGRRFAYHWVASIGARFEIVDAANQPAFLGAWSPGGRRPAALDDPDDES